MAPACVLLDRTVPFRDYDLDPDPYIGGGGGGGGAGVVGGTTAASPESLSLEASEAASAYCLPAMRPDLRVVDPPGVSRLIMVCELSSDPVRKYGRDLPSGFVAAADNNLVLLYFDSYRPAASYRGCYMLIDTASSSVSTIPGIYYMPTYKCPGYGTVIVAREGGAFDLAELFFSFRHPGGARGMLCLWQSSSSERRSEWVHKVGQLPPQVRQPWMVHMSFPVRRRNLICWVNLLHGLLLCDLGRQCELSDLDMSFFALPHSYHISEEQHRHRLLNPQDFSTMACVDGTIKFLTLDGFVEGTPISLVSYSLDLDGPSPSWKKDMVLRLNDLWADKTFISMGVPQITPLFPILSTQEHDVVYLVIAGDMKSVEGFQRRKVQLMLSVDMSKTKLISVTEQNCPRTLLSSRYLLAFNAFQGGSIYHQRVAEAIGMGASGKRIKSGDLRNRIM